RRSSLFPTSPLTAASPSENLAEMPRYSITSVALLAAIPLLAVALPCDRSRQIVPVYTVAAQPGNKPADTPKPAKLERKNYGEKTSSFKTEVIDPTADPPKTRKVDMAAKFEMVWVPGGEFTMGSPDSEPGRDPNEGPQHKVKVHGFWMSKHEVTWDEF